MLALSYCVYGDFLPVLRALLYAHFYVNLYLSEDLIRPGKQPQPTSLNFQLNPRDTNPKDTQVLRGIHAFDSFRVSLRSASGLWQEWEFTKIACEKCTIGREKGNSERESLKAGYCVGIFLVNIYLLFFFLQELNSLNGI